MNPFGGLHTVWHVDGRNFTPVPRHQAPPPVPPPPNPLDPWTRPPFWARAAWKPTT